MKDYFYFLGVSPEADPEEIRTAYRKLAAKYHPDKNNADPYMAARFRELQEAYDTLSDPERKKIYQANFAGRRPAERSTFPPVIKVFSVSEVYLQRDELVTIKWETTHADVVKILPFGLVKPYGERTIKVTEFKEGKFVLILHATNTFINKTVVQGITLMEGEKPAGVAEEPLKHGTSQVPPQTLRRQPTGWSPLLIFWIIFFVIMLMVLLFSN